MQTLLHVVPSPATPSAVRSSCQLSLLKPRGSHLLSLLGKHLKQAQSVPLNIADLMGQRYKYAIIQYLLEGPEIDIKIKPHGNSKGSWSFFRTSTSTKEQIQQLASSSTPKAVVSEMTRERGGEIEARGIAILPRDCHQVSYARQKQRTAHCDPLYSIMLECKLAQGSSNVFVQDVKAAPFPICDVFGVANL